MTNLERSIIAVLNNWHDNLSPVDETELVKYEFTKNKFRNKYLERTGEFLKITKRMEAISFAKICHGLATNYTVNEQLLDKYINWCFDNYDFFVKKYKGFNLNAIVSFAIEWDENFLKFQFEDKTKYSDLKDIKVSDNVFKYFEKYGIPFVATKLLQETDSNKKALEIKILDRLQTQTYDKESLNKLKNMLRMSVENGPYTGDIMFNDYKAKLDNLFKYFPGEPWSK